MWEKTWENMGKYGGLPAGKRLDFTFWKDPPFFNGRINRFDWAIFHGYVSLSEGNRLVDPWI